MNISKNKITIANIEIDVELKDIKNMHLTVNPPHGRIRLAAPMGTDAEVIRLFAIAKLGWMKKHIKQFKEQTRESPREYVSGESHYFQGKKYLLKVIEHTGYNKIELKGTKYIYLYFKPNTDRDTKANLLKEWYRSQLKSQLPSLIAKWEKEIGVKANDWGVRHMLTKWGTCNIDEKRIWINLELAKKPIQCLEYIIVHELLHLLERNHNSRFIAYMNQFMPKWRLHRDELNSLPVAHNDWGY